MRGPVSVLVPLLPIRLTTTSRLARGRPGQLLVIWQNMRCLILPFPTAVPKVAEQFLFLVLTKITGITGRLVLSGHRGDILELGITIRTVAASGVLRVDCKL
jgi:hypothetical protein